jgi:NADH-quinone oxidoreductase subunit N
LDVDAAANGMRLLLKSNSINFFISMLNDLLILMKAELVITFIIFLLLFIKIGKGIKNESMLMLVQFLLLGNFIAGFFGNEEGSLFGDMYNTNPLIVLQKNILALGVYLISLLFSDWLRKHEHLPEFFILMLSALLGMYFLISSGNLLMFFLSLELATIPIAALANFDLAKRVSSEAAMKMILTSAFSSGILLFGISILYGVTGSISFAELPALLDGSPLLVFSFVFLFAAFAFKLSIVPFHLWTADVYEGSPFAVTSFLSVISKGRTCFYFCYCLIQSISAHASGLVQHGCFASGCHYGSWQPVCIAAAEHKTFSCIFLPLHR